MRIFNKRAGSYNMSIIKALFCKFRQLITPKHAPNSALPSRREAYRRAYNAEEKIRATKHAKNHLDICIKPEP